jgi:RNA polymerase sigma-70 factor, ECF subfamily
MTFSLLKVESMQPPQDRDQPLDLALSSSSLSGTRPSLIQGLRINTDAAWERLVECYQPRLVSWCRRRGLDDSATNDVVQDVWISVAKSLPRVSLSTDKGAFRAWLWRIVQRRIIDHRRQNLRGIVGVGGSTMIGRLANAPETNECESSAQCETKSQSLKLTDELQRVMERVSVDYETRTWQAFLRSAMDGHSTDQVATEFGMTAVGVRQLRSRILRRLRNELCKLYTSEFAANVNR